MMYFNTLVALCFMLFVCSVQADGDKPAAIKKSENAPATSQEDPVVLKYPEMHKNLSTLVLENAGLRAQLLNSETLRAKLLNSETREIVLNPADLLALLQQIPVLDPILVTKTPPTDDSYDRNCCKYDVAVAQCQGQVSGLGLCRLGEGVYYFSPVGQALTWFQAQDFCRSHGMELASIETAVENSLLEGKVTALTIDKLGFWMSLYDLNINTQYYWSGTGLPTAPFFDWHPTLLSNTAQENCGMLLRYLGVTKWDDRRCLEQSRFVCELSAPCLDLLTVNNVC